MRHGYTAKHMSFSVRRGCYIEQQLLCHWQNGTMSSVYLCLVVYVFVCVYALCVCMCLCLCVCVCACMCVCVCVCVGVIKIRHLLLNSPYLLCRNRCVAAWNCACIILFHVKKKKKSSMLCNQMSLYQCDRLIHISIDGGQTCRHKNGTISTCVLLHPIGSSQLKLTSLSLSLLSPSLCLCLSPLSLSLTIIFNKAEDV